MILNNTLLLRIFALLTLDDWLSLQFTCKLFHKLVNTESLLESWCINKYPAYITANIPLPSGCNWAWMCKCLSVSTESQSYTSSSSIYGHVLTNRFLFIWQGIGNTRIGIKRIGIKRIGIKVNICRFAFREPRLEYRVGTFDRLILQGHETWGKRNYTYAGPFVNNTPCGIGTVSYQNGEVYHGYFITCDRMGSGIYTWTNGSYYKGQWHKNFPHGNGEYHWVEGDVYRGCFNRGSRHGNGTFTTSDGQIYSDLWNNNVPVYCKFGWYYYECKRCQVTVCKSCKTSKHRSCGIKVIWTIVKERELSCGHVKEAMTGNDPSAS